MPFIVIIKHMPPEIDPDFARVLVRCPMPGHEHEPAQPLGEFMQTDIGERVLGTSLANAKRLMETGLLGKDEAIAIALGAAAVLDTEGKLARAPKEKEAAPDQAASRAEQPAADAKKKVMTVRAA